MNKSIIRAVLVLAVFGLAACASPPEYQGPLFSQRTSDNVVEAKTTPQTTADKVVEVKVTPILDERYGISVGYTGILLEVRNRTAQDLTINWDETLYLQGGAPTGGFSLGGARGGRLRGFDIIFAHETYVVTIYPTLLTNIAGIGTLTEPKLGDHKAMPKGENGIAIKLRLGFEDMSRTLTFTIPGSTP